MSENVDCAGGCGVRIPAKYLNKIGKKHFCDKCVTPYVQEVFSILPDIYGPTGYNLIKVPRAKKSGRNNETGQR